MRLFMSFLITLTIFTTLTAIFLAARYLGSYVIYISVGFALCVYMVYKILEG